MYDTGLSNIKDAGGWGADSMELTRFDQDCEWVTTDYQAGDILIFTMKMMHGAITNTATPQLRLSADIRFVSAPRSSISSDVPDRLLVVAATCIGARG